MKRNDMERIERELKRTQKRDRISEKRDAGRPAQSIGAYIKDLIALLRQCRDPFREARSIGTGQRHFIPGTLIGKREAMQLIGGRGRGKL